MKTASRIVVTLGAILCLFGPVVVQNAALAEELLPEGVITSLEIETGFEPGLGRPVGKFLTVEGDVLVIHDGSRKAYRVAPESPIFKKDTILCQASGEADIQMLDGSRIAIGPSSKLVINEMLYDETRGERASLVEQAAGKCRYFIKSFTLFKRARFRVKTDTVIIGVRGSDFVVSTDTAETEISTLADTVLEVFPLAALCDEAGEGCVVTPFVLSAFEFIRVGETLDDIERRDLAPEEQREIQNSFPPVAESTAPVSTEVRLPVNLTGSETRTVAVDEGLDIEFDLGDFDLVVQEIVEEAESGPLPDYPEEPETP